MNHGPTYTLETSQSPYVESLGGNLPADGVYYDMIRSIHQLPTPFTKAYFSAQNLENVQTMIRNEVQRRIKIRIDRQDDNIVLLAMRAALVANTGVTNVDPTSFINELNQRVVNYSVPRITSNVLSYIAYIRDSTTQPTPPPLPINTSNKDSMPLDLRTQMLN